MKIEKIRKLIQSFEKRNLSTVGKVLLANTMLLSQIWHLAAILPLELKYIHKINKLINIWINGKNRENIHTLLATSKEQGGLGLIDLEKRIKSIKIKSLQFLMTGKRTKEHDILIYWAGSFNKTLGNINIIGPKCENCTYDYGITIKLMAKHRDALKEIQAMKIKDIQQAIFIKQNTTPEYIDIYSGKYSKFISLNFQIATDILKTATKLNLNNRACIFCKERGETIYHLFFECKKLKEIRKEMIKITHIIRLDNQKMTWNYVVNMKNMIYKIEYASISIYKMVIWNKATSIRWGNEINDTKMLKNRLKCEL